MTTKTKVTQCNLQEHRKEQEITALKQENAEFKGALRKLNAEFELFRNSQSGHDGTSIIPRQAAGLAKRKA